MKRFHFACCQQLADHWVILKDILIRISPPTRLNKKTLLLRAWLDLVFLLVLVSSLWSSRTHYYYKVFYTKHLGFFLLCTSQLDTVLTHVQSHFTRLAKPSKHSFFKKAKEKKKSLQTSFWLLHRYIPSCTMASQSTERLFPFTNWEHQHTRNSFALVSSTHCSVIKFKCIAYVQKWMLVLRYMYILNYVGQVYIIIMRIITLNLKTSWEIIKMR